MSRILEAVARHAMQRDGAIALSDDHEQFSYRSLCQQVDAAVALLQRRCRGKGPVALNADNSAAWVILDLALIFLGRPLIPLPLFLGDDQCAHAIKQAGAEWLISDSSGGASHRIEVAGRNFSLEKCTHKPVKLPSETAKITFTSGTTGRPKGVCLSQASMEAVSLSLVDAIGGDKAGIHLAVLPLSVLLENVGGLYSTLLAGGHFRALSSAAIGFARPFEPDFARLVDQLRATRAATAILVPEILRGIIEALKCNQIALPELKFLAVGGARVSDAIVNEGRRLALPIYQGYGLSEAASVVTLNTPEADRAGSVGRLLPHVQLDIAADGEILITNPGYLGYVESSPAQRVFATGDIGSFDDDGYVYVHGRKSNVLITGFGRNISPEWIESELAVQPEIKQAMVFGDGEPALAALIVPSSSSVTDGQVAMAIDTANRKLPQYARVARWKRVGPFTLQNSQLTANGRLQRAVIYEDYGKCMHQILQRPDTHATFFDRLVAETERQRDYLLASDQLRRGLAGAISVETYIQYLGEAYHHVRHTVPLMQLTMARLPPGREWFAGPLNDYIAEETGHEEWILDDIRNAGGNADAVRNGRPRMATEFMIAYAYDFINRMNAVGFFGMVFVLESTSTKLATAGADTLMKSLELPADCFRYLTSHGSLDLEHMKFFESVMAHIDHDEDRVAIVHMAQRMYVLFANLFRSIPLETTDHNELF
jgi:long-chain acyl-CoA synthetase